MIDRNNKGYLVNVGSKDMTLFAEIRGAPYDVILPLLYVSDPFSVYRDKIAYSDGIGATNTPNAKIAFYTAFHIRTIVHANDVTASC